MDKFRQCLTELSAHDTIMAGYYSLTFLYCLYLAAFRKVIAVGCDVIAFDPIMRYFIFLFLEENKYFGYSLGAPHQGAFNEYP